MGRRRIVAHLFEGERILRVKTLKEHVYDGKVRQVYEEYEMEDRFFLAMSLTGNVIKMEDRQMSPNASKRYRRRDLRAEE